MTLEQDRGKAVKFECLRKECGWKLKDNRVKGNDRILVKLVFF